MGLSEMKIERLLSKLSENNIRVEDTRLPDGSRIITASAPPPFPYVGACWGVLVLSPNQTDVAREDVESLLRHTWHLELDFFQGEPPEPEDEAIDPASPGDPIL
jgi:hypothetical protein